MGLGWSADDDQVDVGLDLGWRLVDRPQVNAAALAQAVRDRLRDAPGIPVA
jgi:hypothetical protein